jgi:hypothetical protein
MNAYLECVNMYWERMPFWIKVKIYLMCVIYSFIPLNRVRLQSLAARLSTKWGRTYEKILRPINERAEAFVKRVSG